MLDKTRLKRELCTRRAHSDHLDAQSSSAKRALALAAAGAGAGAGDIARCTAVLARTQHSDAHTTAPGATVLARNKRTALGKRTSRSWCSVTSTSACFQGALSRT